MDVLQRWGAMQIRPNRIGAAKIMAKKVFAGKARYVALSEKTGVPWQVIGVIHARESDCDFGTHLHNGDPLSKRTHHDPAGRPKKGSPPFGFEESAIDALECDHFLGCADWSFPEMVDRLERYNGLGYRGKGIPSPYLWAGSDQYTKGKYVADKVFDVDTVDQQTGCMVILKCLAQLDPLIDPLAVIPLTPVALPVVIADPLPAPSIASVAVNSKTVKSTLGGTLMLKIGAVFAGFSQAFDTMVSYLPGAKEQADAQLSLLKGVASTAHINMVHVEQFGAWAGASLLIYAMVRHSDLKKFLTTGGVAT